MAGDDVDSAKYWYCDVSLCVCVCVCVCACVHVCKCMGEKDKCKVTVENKMAKLFLVA